MPQSVSNSSLNPESIEKLKMEQSGNPFIKNVLENLNKNMVQATLSKEDSRRIK